MSKVRRALASFARVRRRFRQLSARERRVLALAMGLLPVVHQLQQRLPFRRWRRLLERGAPPVQAPNPDNPSVFEIAWSVEVARHWVPGQYQCLPSAYAAHLLLHHYGYASEIQVGVRRNAEGEVEAHAWVECEGRLVIGGIEELDAFAPLPPLTSVGK